MTKAKGAFDNGGWSSRRQLRIAFSPHFSTVVLTPKLTSLSFLSVILLETTFQISAFQISVGGSGVKLYCAASESVPMFLFVDE